ncbi:MAG: GTP 3',8-cyclase MoaA [Chloroflexi bacterium]|nr:GTP 3',8-cyclase MoaA [Chloroflexota bacterium]
MTGLTDFFQRPINYLRISVTDRCNLRCIYCMPPQGISLMPRESMLSYEEIKIIVEAAATLGISKVRLTGGEPLARRGLIDLVAMLASIPGIDDISLTTNGLLLSEAAPSLKEAGLRRVNVSLDTLRPERFSQITRWGSLDEVLAGIDAARSVGLSPIKLNTVIMRDVNDDELFDFANMTVDEGWHVRFIELMPFETTDLGFVPIAEVKKRIEVLGALEPCFTEAGAGPAKYYRLSGARGTIGFIGPLSESFCSGCNRLRLTANGQLRPCLASDAEIDLRQPLRNGATKEDLIRLIQEAVAAKPEGHRLGLEDSSCIAMSRVGG